MSDEPRRAHPGAICSPVGANGVTKAGTVMVCRINPDNPPRDGRPRWGRKDPIVPKRRRGAPRKRQGLEKRYVDKFVASEPEVDTPLPQRLVDQLNDAEIGALRTASGMVWNGPKPRRTQLDKLKAAGLLDVDGKLTKRGLDVLERRDEFKANPQFSDAAEDQARLDKARERVTAEVADRSGDAGTDWSRYGACGTCGAGAGQPCRDLGREGSLNATAHDGRPASPPPVDPAKAAYDKAVRLGIPHLTDDEVQAAHSYPDASPHMRSTLGYTMDHRAAVARVAREDAEMEAARKFRSGGSDDELAAAREAATPRSRARKEMDRQTYLRGLSDDELNRQAAEQTLPFHQRQYRAEQDRRGLAADRSADAGTAWSRYGQCSTCQAGQGQPCHDLRTPGAFNATPHDGRPVVEPAPAECNGTALCPKHPDKRGAHRDDPIVADIEAAYQKLVQQDVSQREREIGPIAGAGYVPISAVRAELGDRYPRDRVDAALDRMIERPDVRLQGSLVPVPDHVDADAVTIGNESRHVLRIGTPASNGTDRAKHATYIDGPDSAGHYGWHCAVHDGEATGFETVAEAVAAAQDHGPLAANAAIPPELADEEPGDFTAEDIAEMRRRDAAADRRLADQLAAADEAGDLTTHQPGDACGHGLWHTGPCVPKDPPYDFEKMVADADAPAEPEQPAWLDDVQERSRTARNRQIERAAREAAQHPGGPAAWAAEHGLPPVVTNSLPGRESMVDPDAQVEDIPLWAQREIDRDAGDDPARVEQLAGRFLTRQRAVERGLRDATEDDLLSLLNDPKVGRELNRAATMELADRRAKAQPQPTHAGPPISGALSSAPMTENGWGFAPDRPVAYHDHGPIGTAVRDMRLDAGMDLDGLPVGEQLGRVATDVVMGRRSSADALNTYKTIRDRLPANSGARRRLDRAISDINAPMIPVPDVPAAAPPPLRRLVADLYAMPMCRGRWRPQLDQAADIARRSASGELRGFRLRDELNRMHNAHHESYGDAGKNEYDEHVWRAMGEMDQWERHRRAAERDAQS